MSLACRHLFVDASLVDSRCLGLGGGTDGRQSIDKAATLDTPFIHCEMDPEESRKH